MSVWVNIAVFVAGFALGLFGKVAVDFIIDIYVRKGHNAESVKEDDFKKHYTEMIAAQLAVQSTQQETEVARRIEMPPQIQQPPAAEEIHKPERGLYVVGEDGVLKLVKSFKRKKK